MPKRSDLLFLPFPEPIPQTTTKKPAHNSILHSFRFASIQPCRSHKLRWLHFLGSTEPFVLPFTELRKSCCRNARRSLCDLCVEAWARWCAPFHTKTPNPTMVSNHMKYNAFQRHVSKRAHSMTQNPRHDLHPKTPRRTQCNAGNSAGKPRLAGNELTGTGHSPDLRMDIYFTISGTDMTERFGAFGESSSVPEAWQAVQADANFQHPCPNPRSETSGGPDICFRVRTMGQWMPKMIRYTLERVCATHSAIVAKAFGSPQHALKCTFYSIRTGKQASNRHSAPLCVIG